MKENVIVEKSFAFAVDIVRCYKTRKCSGDFVISRQMLRSGTSIGANVEEAQAAQSRKDFENKLNIALKEARECHYWIRLLKATEPSDNHLVSLEQRVIELKRILTSILVSSRSKVSVSADS